jgi:predicted nucleic acid-binding Zn ribbon protein
MNEDHSYKRINSQSLGDVIQQFIRANGLQPKLDEASVVKNWEEIVGKMIARHTQDLYIKHRKIFVRFDSAALRQEMMYAKSKLIEKINNSVGHQCIDEVVFL